MGKYAGYPLPLGVSEYNGYVNFSVEVKPGDICTLMLYKKGAKEPEEKLDLPEKDAVGNVRFLALPKSKLKGKEYHYEINGKAVVDLCSTSIVEYDNNDVRAAVLAEEYDWEGDKPLEIPYSDVIAYSLHVRGFTKHKTSKVKKKGTFTGIVEKIPYFKELGINQIQCMPVYSFFENDSYTNYWGYGEGYYYALKGKYAATANPRKELKDMVKKCHQEGIEVVLNMPFSEGIPMQAIAECLRYYVITYHIDGFIVNPLLVSVDSLKADPILCRTKILVLKDEFQNVMRCFLKGDECMTESVMHWLKQHTSLVGSCNYITGHTGFTMADLVSYEHKHNEANGEDNNDGPDYNCSWNCGVEGPTRKRSIIELRKRQMRNAFCLLLLSQGTPCILAGDEFANSQQGNNNVYCQDNETAWLNWNQLNKEQELFEFVKTLISLRKKYPILHSMKPLLGRDQTSCGIPDVSFHGENAWQVSDSILNRKLGVYYHSQHKEDNDCFIAYNMHWEEHDLALPALPKGKKWYQVLSTGEPNVGVAEKVVKNQKMIELEGRTIAVYIGR